jgi:hypothetical protein
MSLQIPASERKYMAALVSAKPEVLDAVQGAISECRPAMVYADLASALMRKLRDVPGASARVVNGVVRTLLAVYSVLRAQGEMSASEAAAEMVRTVRADEGTDEGFGTPPKGWDVFQKQLEQLLSNEKVLGISAKAVNVASDTQRHVHSVRILTDARPIFGENAKDGPQAFAVIHTLKIDYFQDDGDHSWFVSLDGDDLESLQGAAERALAKERSTRVMLEKLGAPVLSWKASDDGK